MKPILDACCGSRMFWFDKNNPAVVFMDNRELEDITGLKDYQNKFWVAKMILERQGHLVMNPAGLPAGFDYEDYMRICFAMIDVCDAVYMLDNWRDSPGAIREYEYAGATGKGIIYAKGGDKAGRETAP